eukprot:m.36666 g.36666  ORF g.36666 m.36666 type:complete len:95 (-) comp7602_c0_seq1:971-1255(-)
MNSFLPSRLGNLRLLQSLPLADSPLTDAPAPVVNEARQKRPQQLPKSVTLHRKRERAHNSSGISDSAIHQTTIRFSGVQVERELIRPSEPDVSS